MMNCDFAPMSIDVFFFFCGGVSQIPQKIMRCVFQSLQNTAESKRATLPFEQWKKGPWLFREEGIVLPSYMGIIEK